ncbi:MAG: LppX_LprAFG lipoprotein [Anaerolineaceae bacterium]|nr:MAG: LppX_LprAFG lipoprotein [Anaerolineaceae bacterium]
MLRNRVPAWWNPISIILLLTLIGACVSPTPEVMDPEEIVFRSVERMKSLSGFHFVIERSGALAFLNEEQTLAFRRAEGDFVAPDRARATIRVILPGLVAEVQVINIGDIQWETNFLTGEWQELPPDWGFNPAALFDAEVGIQPILEKDLSTLEYLGLEELDEVPGKPLYALTGEVDGERLHQLSYGMMGPEVMAITLWIAPETFELYRMQITEAPREEEEPTIWQVDFWDYDKVVEITPP